MTLGNGTVAGFSYINSISVQVFHLLPCVYCSPCKDAYTCLPIISTLYDTDTIQVFCIDIIIYSGTSLLGTSILGIPLY